MIDDLKHYNDRFAQNYSYGDENNDSVFEYIDRNSNLILSAPHATRSFANKKEKVADLYTGAIVEYLGNKNKISTIIRTKFVPYRELVSDYVVKQSLQNHYFLDIHGFNQDIDYDICLGIGELSEQNYPYLSDIIRSAKSYDLKIIVNHPNYTGKWGLTGRYQKEFGKPNVIQIEIKKYLRDFYKNADLVASVTLPFMEDVLKLYL